MSRVDLFNGVEITIEGTSTKYHSYDDWSLYVTNTDYIKEPKQNTNYVAVPGRDGLLDLSDVVTGRPTYSGREIKIVLAGHRNKTVWDSVISTFRNNINGRICRFVFDNDKSFYWRGRVDIKDFKSALNYGTFQVDIPNADPYKYDVLSSADPWLWDPFNFETGVIIQTQATVISGSGSITVPHGHMPTCPTIVVSEQVSGTFEMEYNGVTYPLTQGSNKIASLMVGGDQNVTLNFTGSATVQIVYRGGSL